MTPNITFGRVRFDKASDSVTRYFEIDKPDNSGIIQSSIDQRSNSAVITVEANKPLRMLGGGALLKAVTEPVERHLVFERIENDEIMKRLINYMLGNTSRWDLTGLEEREIDSDEYLVIEKKW